MCCWSFLIFSLLVFWQNCMGPHFHLKGKLRFVSIEKYFLQTLRGTLLFEGFGVKVTSQMNSKPHLDPRPRPLKLKSPFFFLSDKITKNSNGFHSAGVVPKPKGEMEKEGAFWSDAAGPNTLLHSLRVASSDTPWELCTGTNSTLIFLIYSKTCTHLHFYRFLTFRSPLGFKSFQLADWTLPFEWCITRNISFPSTFFSSKQDEHDFCLILLAQKKKVFLVSQLCSILFWYYTLTCRSSQGSNKDHFQKSYCS